MLSLIFFFLKNTIINYSCSCCSSRVRPFVTPWTAARQASLSFTVSWSLLKLMVIESMMLSSHLTLCHPLLLLPFSWDKLLEISFRNHPSDLLHNRIGRDVPQTCSLWLLSLWHVLLVFSLRDHLALLPIAWPALTSLLPFALFPALTGTTAHLGSPHSIKTGSCRVELEYKFTWIF